MSQLNSQLYPYLLSPLKVGAHTLPNRVIMGSLHTRLENEPDGVHRLAEFYAARARGGVGLIVTGGVSPNFEGRVEQGAWVLDSSEQLVDHTPIVQAVHEAGAKIALQILHTGIYAKHDEIIGPSALRSVINPRQPRAFTVEQIEQTIEDFVNCAVLAQQAGYDGVEVMGSEGYLMTQFTAPRTNKREDEWGGSLENRIRFPVEVVRRTRERVGTGLLIMYRISAIDLVEGGLSGDEIDRFAQALEQAGADVLNTGIGWHESVVPTIATSVPRAAFAFAAARLKKVVSIPVVASNRINMPSVAEEILERGQADMVSLARAFLADPDFVVKAATGRTDEINTCIGCNQACLDYIFTDRIASCLVNPKACHETEFTAAPPLKKLKVAVVGAGPAGLACAITAAERGHQVQLFEAGNEVGGQLNLARRIPGKEQEFAELVRYFKTRLTTTGVNLHLNQRVDAATLVEQGFERIVIATGIKPRMPSIAGIEHAKVVSYTDVILGRAQVGERVAIIGTGGIGHDVAELLTSAPGEPQTAEEFLKAWGVDPTLRSAGGLQASVTHGAQRKVVMLQRGTKKPGAGLGKSTGWIHRTKLTKRGVTAVSGCIYEKIDDQGLHYSVSGERHVLDVDTIVLCAGQDSEQDLADGLAGKVLHLNLIGGARIATELDAMRAIDEGTRLAFAW
ncbi:MAG: NADPH-dependent 2,4-dienoyl-CoA reductase [Alcaligenaceae bacterium]|nr:MAG: NADPH-dependent 2,4-dienoyl-CoA reductase [Alcaligenaceae bacterium]